MATVSQLMAVGFTAAQAQMLATGPILTITPAGSSQATATLITSPSSILGTAATGGVMLPPSVGQPPNSIYNNSGNAQNVYPAVGEGINSLTNNTAVSIPTGKTGNFTPGHKGWLFSVSA